MIEQAHLWEALLQVLEDFKGAVFAPIIDTDDFVVIANVAKQIVGIDDELFDSCLVVVGRDDYRDRGDRQSPGLF
jgi:hypothetical protein